MKKFKVRSSNRLCNAAYFVKIECMKKKYIPSEIEPKWQRQWEKDELFKIDLTDFKKRKYILVEFSYPSGDLHIGHWFAFVVPDIYARYARMRGHNVFFPNGFDAFGLPAENAAIKKGIHPKDWTLSNIKKMKKQFSTMGASFNWEQEVITCLPEYYKWNQWIFLKMLEKGIAYRGSSLANWCPNCQTVLANENVESGKCWRCGTDIVQKDVEQWFLKITDYAERLLWGDSPKVDWPKAVREGQNNWIGKSEGTDIEFKIDNSQSTIKVYTVFPETIFGVTYMVLAPEHQLVHELTAQDQKEEVNKYIKLSQRKSELERKSLERQKTGVFTGSYCINPVNGQKAPVWIADYVISTYGTGAVMGVPGSDHRDFEFAKKYGLEIIRVIGKNENDHSEVLTADDVLEEGWIVNSGQFNTLETPNPAREKIKNWMEEKHFAKRTINYQIHDWSVSRQRYWGTPIPIIYCSDCGIVPVPQKDLPVELPYEVDYAPKGKPPLATAEDWVNVNCPKCGKMGKREVETMDTFFDSSWYFFRYLDPGNDKEIFDTKVIENWLPLDIYFGGAEHTLGHTLYSRFFTKFFHDLKLISFDEYAKKRINRGLILGSDGQKMSKSRGNVINPDEQVKSYGADAVRLYLAFIGPYAETVAPWETGGLNGVYHFLQRVWALSDKVQKDKGELQGKDLKMMHKTIKKVTEDLENLKFNTAVASLMEYLNYLSAKDKVHWEEYKTLLLLLSPFAPHITEEIWSEKAGPVEKYSIHKQPWLKFDNKFLEEEEIEVAVQINGRVRDIIMIQKDILSNNKEVENMSKKSDKVNRYLHGVSVKKVIYIPGKIINFVISSQ